ncbi:hypothetical protein BDN67DRAFT_1006384 [Paxillus ammoniavirescens]|nr:hypothetical protein BDN67DRAFT_1006384 [Paxillus ammoniavirescens]
MRMVLNSVQKFFRKFLASPPPSLPPPPPQSPPPPLPQPIVTCSCSSTETVHRDYYPPVQHLAPATPLSYANVYISVPPIPIPPQYSHCAYPTPLINPLLQNDGPHSQSNPGVLVIPPHHVAPLQQTVQHTPIPSQSCHVAPHTAPLLHSVQHAPIPTQPQNVAPTPVMFQKSQEPAALPMTKLNHHGTSHHIPTITPVQPPPTYDPTRDALSTSTKPQPDSQVRAAGRGDVQKGEGSDKVLWDGWPDADFQQLFTWEQFHQTSGLMEHWANMNKGGDKHGNDRALTWQEGFKTHQQCMGVIVCQEPTCGVITRPQTRQAKVQAQLTKGCICGSKLQYLDSCPATSTLHAFRDGVFFIHKGTHNHPRPAHKLHLMRSERTKFEVIVAAHPNAKPSQLLAGIPGITGPQQSVVEILSVLINMDRIKAELRRMRDMHSGEFADDFANFQNDHPDFIVHHTFGVVSVVVMQTPYMASTMIKDFIDNEAVNGIVSDVAHGFWKDSKNLLIFSSTFSPDLE